MYRMFSLGFVLGLIWITWLFRLFGAGFSFFCYFSVLGLALLLADLASCGLAPFHLNQLSKERYVAGLYWTLSQPGVGKGLSGRD